MAVSAARPSVTTDATRLSVGRETDYTSGRSLVVYNPGPASVTLGPTTVAADEGFELVPGATVSADLARGEDLYGIVGTGSQVVHVLQVGV